MIEREGFHIIRLIIDRDKSPVWNMSSDLVLGKFVGKEVAPLTLKLYTWNPPTLSIGRFQKLKDINLDYARDNGICVIRRPTGGRAVLHLNDITYSFIFPLNYEKVGKTLMESYMKISKALVRMLQILGANVQIEKLKKRSLKTPACYDTPSIYEVIYEGKKLIGSAQMRNKKENFVIQHGIIPIVFNLNVYVNLFNLPEDKRNELKKMLKRKTIDLFTITGRLYKIEDFIKPMKEAFSQIFQQEVYMGSYSKEEFQKIEEEIKNYEEVWCYGI